MASGASLGRRAAHAAVGWLPEQRPARVLLAVSFIDSLGTGMFLAGSALFFTRSLGLSAAAVGLGLSLAGIAGFVCSVLVGRLADRIGALPMLVALQFWRGACFIAYPFADSFGLFILVACLAGSGEWAAPPVVQSLVASLVGKDSRVRTMSAMMLVRNVGFTVGAAAAAWTIAVGGTAVYTVLVFVDAGSFFVSGAILLAVRRLAVAARPVTEEPDMVAAVRPGARFLALAGLNGLLYVHAVLLTIGLPLWIANSTRAPEALIGAIVVLNTILAVSLQMRLARGVDGPRSGALRQLRAGVALVGCCLLLIPTTATSPAVTVVLVLAATAALTIGEVYQGIGAWAVSYALSPESRRGYFLSVYNLGQTGVMIVGPWVVTSTVLPAGGPGWIGLAAVLGGAGALVVVLERVRRPEPDEGGAGAGTAADRRGRDGQAVPGRGARAGRVGARDREPRPGGGDPG